MGHIRHTWTHLAGKKSLPRDAVNTLGGIVSWWEGGAAEEKIKDSDQVSEKHKSLNKKGDILCSNKKDFRWNFHFHIWKGYHFSWNCCFPMQCKITKKPLGKDRKGLQGPSDANAGRICLKIRELTVWPVSPPRKQSKIAWIPTSTKLAGCHTWLLTRKRDDKPREIQNNMSNVYLADFLTELRSVDAQRDRGHLLNKTSYHLLAFSQERFILSI